WRTCIRWTCRLWWTWESERIGETQNEEADSVLCAGAAGRLLFRSEGDAENGGGEAEGATNCSAGLSRPLQHHQRAIRRRGASRLGAAGRGSLLRADPRELLQRRGGVSRAEGLHRAVRHQQESG